MFNKPKKETTTYGIIGLGRFGYALAESLHPQAPNFVWAGRGKVGNQEVPKMP
ncbi:MAG: hypothetical protein ACLVHV_07885 [Oscillospiraceae bacterium]